MMDFCTHFPVACSVLWPEFVTIIQISTIIQAIHFKLTEEFNKTKTTTSSPCGRISKRLNFFAFISLTKAANKICCYCRTTSSMKQNKKQTYQFSQLTKCHVLNTCQKEQAGEAVINSTYEHVWEVAILRQLFPFFCQRVCLATHIYIVWLLYIQAERDSGSQTRVLQMFIN